MMDRSVTMLALPLTEAQSPELVRKLMLMCESLARLSVLPDSVLVWKSRSIPPVSWEILGQGVLLESVGGGRTHTWAANAIHLDTRFPELASRVVIILNLQFDMKWLRSWIFCS